MGDYFFSILLAAIAVYLLYSAIRGKGRLFQAENLKEKYKDNFVKVLRWFYLALSILMLLNTAASVTNAALFETRYRFTESYTNVLGEKYESTVDFKYTAEEMNKIIAPEGAPPPTEGFPPPKYEGGMERKEGMEDVLPTLSYNLVYGLSTGFMIASILPLIGVFVSINIMTDKQKKKESQAKAAGNASHMPSAAFDFDEEG